MALMQYDRFREIFNETIFERSKADLLTKIADNPSRYIGLFRPTRPKAKILQNLLQSHEIRFGDAFELVIEEYLSIKGCGILQKRFVTSDDNALDIDQCFARDGKIYFIEQKIRDDHDSTKKRGQIQNFEKKLDLMLSRYSENELVGIFYFVDPEMTKNCGFYTGELEKMSADYGVETRLFYGKALFDYLGYTDVWSEIIEYLERWRREIPDLPEVNFDMDAECTFEEIKDLKPLVFRKLLENDKLFHEIVLTLFPEKRVLRLLLDYFDGNQKVIYRTIAHNLRSKL